MSYNKKDLITGKGEGAQAFDELIRQLQLICIKEGIPMFLSMAIADDGKKTTYINKLVSPVVAKRKLTKDVLTQHVLLHNGFVAVLPHSVEIDRDVVHTAPSANNPDIDFNSLPEEAALKAIEFETELSKE